MLNKNIAQRLNIDDSKIPVQFKLADIVNWL